MNFTSTGNVFFLPRGEVDRIRIHGGKVEVVEMPASARFVEIEVPRIGLWVPAESGTEFIMVLCKSAKNYESTLVRVKVPRNLEPEVRHAA